jgi:hypothetical protein
LDGADGKEKWDDEEEEEEATHESNALTLVGDD